MLTRSLSAAVRLDRTTATRVVAPLRRLDRAAGARLAPAGALLLGLLVQLLRRGVQRPADRLASVVADWLLPPSATTGEAAGPARTSAGRHRRSHGWRTPAREIALCSGLVLLAGLAAVGVREPAPEQAVAARAADAPGSVVDRPVPRSGPLAEPGSARAEARPGVDLAVPAPARPTAPATAPAAAPAPAAEPAPPPPATAAAPAVPTQRWLPTGTGMWLHDWRKTEGGDPRKVVRKALQSGFTHLYVQTGSTKKGWIGDEVLRNLMPATAGTDLRVIAWDFPKLIDPTADAKRMAKAATGRIKGVPRVAAVAPDIETAAEGTRLRADAVAHYYRVLRQSLPRDVAILATVPWPSEKRTGFYPYAESAAHSDAFVPMAYWYNRAPHTVTATSMDYLRRFGLPVMPVGQGYDGRIDAPYLPPDPDPAASVQAFVDMARDRGARSISLWSWQTTGGPQWQVLARAGKLEWPPAP